MKAFVLVVLCLLVGLAACEVHVIRSTQELEEYMEKRTTGKFLLLAAYENTPRPLEWKEVEEREDELPSDMDLLQMHVPLSETPLLQSDPKHLLFGVKGSVDVITVVDLDLKMKYFLPWSEHFAALFDEEEFTESLKHHPVMKGFSTLEHGMAYRSSPESRADTLIKVAQTHHNLYAGPLCPDCVIEESGCLVLSMNELEKVVYNSEKPYFVMFFNRMILHLHSLHDFVELCQMEKDDKVSYTPVMVIIKEHRGLKLEENIALDRLHWKGDLLPRYARIQSGKIWWLPSLLFEERSVLEIPSSEWQILETTEELNRFASESFKTVQPLQIKPLHDEL